MFAKKFGGREGYHGLASQKENRQAEGSNPPDGFLFRGYEKREKGLFTKQLMKRVVGRFFLQVLYYERNLKNLLELCEQFVNNHLVLFDEI